MFCVIINSHSVALSVFEIRLSEDSRGRVEVFYAGKWGAVCGSKWDQTDANVVCRELGYTRAERPSTGSEFGPSWGPIWMDSVACSGEETSLQYCGHTGWGLTDCSHENEAGVICTGTRKETRVRLIFIFSVHYR